MKCQTCEFEFEPTSGMQCPRCGTTLRCSATACAECDACSGIIEQLRRSATDQLTASEKAE